MNRFKADYWEERYKAQQTGWDAGAPTTPFVDFFKFYKNELAKILIPGCGRAYEGELLWRSGFRNVWLLDLAPSAKEAFLERVPDFPENQFLLEGFFDHTATYDLILEQTFFCALEPTLRPRYAEVMSELLNPGGELVGVLFIFPLTEQGPPFGGSAEEYLNYFEPYFDIAVMEPCRNSIKPRMGNELFIRLKKHG